MAKTIIKEIGIVLLILIAVILVLAIIFYEYIPNNKTVPIELEAYTIPENIKQELQISTAEENIVRTYYIDSTDLDLYESTNDYDKGKANPFADYTQNATENTTNENTTNENTANKNTTKNANNVTNNNSTSNNEELNNTNKKEVYINTPGKNY